MQVVEVSVEDTENRIGKRLENDDLLWQPQKGDKPNGK